MNKPTATYKMISVAIALHTAACVAQAATPTPDTQLASAQSAKPNIILILTDDLGYSDLGCYGSTQNRTPNIDRLAKSGIRFTDFYAAASVCGPSRAGLLTGTYPMRAGVPTNPHPAKVTEGYKPFGLDSRKQWSMARMLKQAGYATSCIGKWHLGYKGHFRPSDHGFDEFFGLPHDIGAVPSGSVPLTWYRDNKPLEKKADKDLVTKRCTEEAIDFIDRQKDGPFFIYLSHPMPHTKLGASKAFKGRSGNGLYCDVIEELDWSVGQIVQKLEDEGLTDNTIVIFTSDNGPWVNAPGGLFKDGTPRWGSSKPLQKWKFHWGHEGGSRVPCIVSWPGQIKEGRTSCALSSALDLFPTFAELAGVPTQAAWSLDGNSQTKLWLAASDDATGKDAITKRYCFTATPYQRNRRKDKTEYDFQVQPLLRTPIGAVREGHWKYVRYTRGKKGSMVPARCLYDMLNDKEERVDLSDEFPEVAARLAKALKQEESRFRTTFKELEK